MDPTPQPISITSRSLADTLRLGEALGRLCRPGDTLALDGELGAGKTQLVRGLARGLGLDPAQVSSPTFVMMHVYEPPDDDSLTGRAPLTLLHLDAYRIAGPDDLETLGFDDELRRQSVSVVEWASLIEPALGEDRLHIYIEHAGDDTRHLALTPRGHWQPRLARAAGSLEQGRYTSPS